jgi:signal transduction histidine kinase
MKAWRRIKAAHRIRRMARDASDRLWRSRPRGYALPPIRILHNRRPMKWSDRLLRLAMLALVAVLSAIVAGGAPAATTRVTQALVVDIDAPQFPTGAMPSTVALPDVWAKTRPTHGGAVWYRISFAAPRAAVEGELLGVLIERVCSHVQVYLNSQLVHTSGREAKPSARTCYQPQHFTLPGLLLKGEGNTLDVKVQAPPLASVASSQRAGTLSAIEIGPAAEISARFDQEQFWRSTLPQIAAGTLLLLGAFILLIGLLNWRDRYLVWFGGVCLAWTLMSSRLWWSDYSLPLHWAELIVTGTVPLLVLCCVQFLLHYARWTHRVIDVALLVQCVVVPASLMLAGQDRLYTLASAWYLVLTLEVVIAMLWHLRLTAQRRPRDVLPMAVLIGAAAALIGIEFAMQQDLLGETQRPLGPLALPLIFALLGARLLWQHARALQAAEIGQKTLESRVREATLEMERSFKMMAELRVEQVSQQERKRIAADLHDDLGAKLLTIVHTSTDERIATLAREALEEMRLSVRGLTGKPVRLTDALGDWRAEVVMRLSQAGVESEWRAPAEDELPEMFAARAYVQTTRILREAVSNIIKHSGASHCSVSSVVLDGDSGGSPELMRCSCSVIASRGCSFRM